jgi:hypothetical protein
MLPPSLNIVKPHCRYHNDRHQPLHHNTLTMLSSLHLRISGALARILSKLRPKREDGISSRSSEKLLPGGGAAASPTPARPE